MFEFWNGSAWTPVSYTQSGTDVHAFARAEAGFVMAAPYSATTAFRIQFTSAATASVQAKIVDHSTTPVITRATIGVMMIVRAPNSVIAIAAPAIIAANGISTTNVTVTVTDIYGDPVVGAQITLTATGGTLGTSSGSADTGGVFKTTLLSSIISQTVTVTATSGGKHRVAHVGFVNVDNPATSLSGSYTVNTNTVRLGDVLTFTFVLTNNGQSVNDGVVMSATVPDYTHLTGTVQGGNPIGALLLAAQPDTPVTVNNGYVHWSGSLQPGESHTIIYAVVVDQYVSMPRGIHSQATGAISSVIDFTLPISINMTPHYKIFLPSVRKTS